MPHDGECTVNEGITKAHNKEVEQYGKEIAFVKTDQKNCVYSNHADKFDDDLSSPYKNGSLQYNEDRTQIPTRFSALIVE